MDRIRASVGRSGVNQESDVTLIQQLLNSYPIPGETTPLKVDGMAGENTYKKIEAFQTQIVAMAHPDGRIDPDGKTFRKLAGLQPASTYSLSDKGIELLQSIEQLATSPYDDQTGKDISSWVEGATIGYGHLISRTEWSKYKNGVTEQQAHTLFEEDLQPYVNAVRGAITTNITQNEFDALVILTFNIGTNGFESSSVVKLSNNPQATTRYTSLEEAWKAWNKSQGKVNKGLQHRRQAEWNIYSKNIYQKW